MSAAYQHLALTEVKPGMILSDELLDQQGNVLLPKGAVLTANTIALLPSHGIDMLAVLRADAATVPDPGVIEQRQAHLFRHHNIDDPSDWATALLRRYMLDFRLEREIAP
jgi:hypothetical protein